MELPKNARIIARSVVLPFAVAILCLLAAGFLFKHVPTLNGWELQDKERASRLRPLPRPNPQIVLITFDDSDGPKLGIGPDRRNPTRPYHARLLSLLDAAGAKAALVDVEFSAETKDGGDLPKALKALRTLKVTLADMAADGLNQTTSPPAGVFDTIAIWNDRTSDRVRLGSIQGAKSAATQSYFGGYPLQYDSVNKQNILWAPISLAMQVSDVPASAPQVLNPIFFSAGPLEWQLDAAGVVEGRWLESAKPFVSWDFADALQMLKDSRRSVFRDKIVLIGNTGAGDTDQVADFGRIPGVYFLAQMVNTALLRNSAQFSGAPTPIYWAYCLLLGYGAFMAVRPKRPLVTAAVLAGLLAVCWGWQRWYAVSNDQFWPAVVPTFIVCLSAFVGLLIGRYWTDSLEFWAGPGEVATVLFLDLRGSTKLLNEIGADRYRKALTMLFDRYGKHLRRYGGRIERNTGDGFIAVFREGRSQNHAIRCADCCEGLIEITRDVGRELGIPLAIALGFESGVVTGDYIDESGRRAWSSSGATVHLSQRLQSLCGELGIEVAIGPVARRLISGSRPCEVVTHAVVKGFDEPVEVSTFSGLSAPEKSADMQ